MLFKQRFAAILAIMQGFLAVACGNDTAVNDMATPNSSTDANRLEATQQGSAGAMGSAGPQGPAGPAGPAIQWQDANGVLVAGLLGINALGQPATYVDAQGYLWSTPLRTGSGEAANATAAFEGVPLNLYYYTTNNCSGTAYMVDPPGPKVVLTNYGNVQLPPSNGIGRFSIATTGTTFLTGSNLPVFASVINFAADTPSCTTLTGTQNVFSVAIALPGGLAYGYQGSGMLLANPPPYTPVLNN